MSMTSSSVTHLRIKEDLPFFYNWSATIRYRENTLLICRASISSYGNLPYVKYWIIGVIYILAFSSTITSSTFVLGTSKVSWIIFLFSLEPLVLANCANILTLVFSSRGICITSNFVKPFANCINRCKYFSSDASFVWKSPLIWLTINWELVLTIKWDTLTSLATFNPGIIA